MGEQGDGKVEAGDTKEQKRVGVGDEAGFELHVSGLRENGCNSTRSTTSTDRPVSGRSSR